MNGCYQQLGDDNWGKAKEELITMWNNHAKPATVLSNGHHHRMIIARTVPLTRVHGETWMRRANNEALIGEIKHAKGPQCGTHKKKNMMCYPFK